MPCQPPDYILVLGRSFLNATFNNNSIIMLLSTLWVRETRVSRVNCPSETSLKVRPWAGIQITDFRIRIYLYIYIHNINISGMVSEKKKDL